MPDIRPDIIIDFSKSPPTIAFSAMPGRVITLLVKTPEGYRLMESKNPQDKPISLTEALGNPQSDKLYHFSGTIQAPSEAEVYGYHLTYEVPQLGMRESKTAAGTIEVSGDPW